MPAGRRPHLNLNRAATCESVHERDNLFVASSTSAAAFSAWMPILLYHRVLPVALSSDPFRISVSTDTFAAHLSWLKRRGYRSLSFRELDDTLTGARGPELASAPSVAITFDDGYRDVYQHAWPILKRYGFTATVFLVSDAIGGDNGFDAPYGKVRSAMLSATEIRELHKGGVTFGSHTASHPGPLLDVDDSRLRDELARSRSEIEAVVDAPVEYFAYPHNKVNDRVEGAVRAAGYRLACTGNGSSFSPYRLTRIEPHLRVGPSVEVAMAWRHLKWVARRRFRTPATAVA